MASAKHGYRHVTALFDDETRSPEPATQPSREAAWTRLVGTLDTELLAEVVRVERLTPTIVEVVVKAPAAARHFHPGQFYRLQNFEALASRAKAPGEPPLLMEGIALTGAWVDKEQGLLSMIALEMGGSSDLCAMLEHLAEYSIVAIVLRPARAVRSASDGVLSRRGRGKPDIGELTGSHRRGDGDPQ